jgi:hypothetical protein
MMLGAGHGSNAREARWRRDMSSKATSVTETWVWPSMRVVLVTCYVRNCHSSAGTGLAAWGKLAGWAKLAREHSSTTRLWTTDEAQHRRVGIAPLSEFREQ